jgi:adenylate cyclase, class 2
MKEVEILVKVLDTTKKALSVLGRYDTEGAKEVLDIYFYDPLRKELQMNGENFPKQWFRIRSKDKKSFITFKEDVFNKQAIWIHSEELETEVKDFQLVKELVEKLGFKELVRIKNKKHTFKTKEYEIVLEEVENLGLFLEVEKLNVDDKENTEKIKEEIQNFIDNLGIRTEKESNMGKPEMMLRKIKSKL